MEKNEIQPFRFGIVEEKDEEVIIEIKQEDYEQDLAAGIPEDELLNPESINSAEFRPNAVQKKKICILQI